jgi:hypothetical protein
MPQPHRAHFRQCMTNAEGACQPLDIGGAVVSANIRKPVGLCHDFPLSKPRDFHYEIAAAAASLNMA